MYKYLNLLVCVLFGVVVGVVITKATYKPIRVVGYLPLTHVEECTLRASVSQYGAYTAPVGAFNGDAEAYANH